MEKKVEHEHSASEVDILAHETHRRLLEIDSGAVHDHLAVLLQLAAEVSRERDQTNAVCPPDAAEPSIEEAIEILDGKVLPVQLQIFIMYAAEKLTWVQIAQKLGMELISVRRHFIAARSELCLGLGEGRNGAIISRFLKGHYPSAWRRS